MIKMNLDVFQKVNNVYYLSEKSLEFSDLYTKVRDKEQRILTDSEVATLPFLKNHKLSNEWELRQQSTRRFLSYLNKKNTPLTILDLGCGNGWFSNAIATASTQNNVLGLDLNVSELEQASRVFKQDNLQFAYGNIFEINLTLDSKFDIITLNACVQYFPDFRLLFSKLKTFLKPQGEIHIIDSPFYDTSEIKSAKQRTENYYKELGFPEMTEHYFHHSKNDISSFQTLYHPTRSFLSKLFKKDSPFSWIVFKNRYF